VVSRLVCRDLAFEYPGGIRALEGVDLRFEAGDLAVVIGPNGSGKSTLLACLAGLRAPQRGAVEIDGAPVLALSNRERARRIAVVPQYLPRVPDATVEDFAFGGRYAHVDGWRGTSPLDVEAVRAALAECDVEALAGRALDELSGGQRQRVLVARAIAQGSPTLIVDEPTSSLDPEHQIAVFELIARRARGGATAIVATHDLNLASQFASRLVVLAAGRVAASGAPKDVLRREVLEPVYGARLRFGTQDGVVFALPWKGAAAE
jgi:iron complex transport system ATP-binding protein